MASRSEVMLPPAGSEARWREEVMPGRASGEVMLALTHQEAKTKEKEQANQSNLIRTNLFCHPEALLFRIWASKDRG
ncbi:hypothetical protein Y696_04195 [Mesotoga sp. H07pep.5.4]|nr:hypothetical protein Y696_04195 [Mesotoga sp. H07pep.5.4]